MIEINFGDKIFKKTTTSNNLNSQKNLNFRKIFENLFPEQLFGNTFNNSNNNNKTRPAWAGFKTAEEGRANTPFGVSEPCGPSGEVNPQK
jgi:hypothetical protein